MIPDRVEQEYAEIVRGHHMGANFREGRQLTLYEVIVSNMRTNVPVGAILCGTKGDPYLRSERLLQLEVTFLLALTVNLLFFETEDKWECQCRTPNVLVHIIDDATRAACLNSTGCDPTFHMANTQPQPLTAAFLTFILSFVPAFTIDQFFQRIRKKDIETVVKEEVEVEQMVYKDKERKGVKKRLSQGGKLSKWNRVRKFKTTLAIMGGMGKSDSDEGDSTTTKRRSGKDSSAAMSSQGIVEQCCHCVVSTCLGKCKRRNKRKYNARPEQEEKGLTSPTTAEREIEAAKTRQVRNRKHLENTTKRKVLWCVAFSLSIIVGMGCVFMIAEYTNSYTQALTIMWLESSALSLAINMFIYGPLKGVAIAVLKSKFTHRNSKHEQFAKHYKEMNLHGVRIIHSVADPMANVAADSDSVARKKFGKQEAAIYMRRELGARMREEMAKKQEQETAKKMAAAIYKSPSRAHLRKTKRGKEYALQGETVQPANQLSAPEPELSVRVVRVPPPLPPRRVRMIRNAKFRTKVKFHQMAQMFSSAAGDVSTHARPEPEPAPTHTRDQAQHPPEDGDLTSDSDTLVLTTQPNTSDDDVTLEFGEEPTSLESIWASKVISPSGSLLQRFVLLLGPRLHDRFSMRAHAYSLHTKHTRQLDISSVALHFYEFWCKLVLVSYI